MAFEPRRSIADIALANTGRFPTAAGGLARGYQQGLDNKRRDAFVDQRQNEIDRRTAQDERQVLLEETLGHAAALDALPPESQQAYWEKEINPFRWRTGGQPIPYSPENATAFMAKAQSLMGRGGGGNVQSTFVDEEGFINIVRRDGSIEKTDSKRGQNMKLVDDGAGGKMLVPVFGSAAGQAPQAVVPTDTAIDNAADRAGAIESATQEAASDSTPNRIRTEGTEQRHQDNISAGLDAADAIPDIRRALTLLDQVGTGKPQEIALQAKRMFGVEGADEGELSGNLGKAVLSQLRDTFGAQFTEKEGKRLEAIEASFGKSTATNKRLLNKAMRIMERSVNRGIKSAKAIGDNDLADEIRDAMNFTLDPVEEDVSTLSDEELRRQLNGD